MAKLWGKNGHRRYPTRGVVKRGQAPLIFNNENKCIFNKLSIKVCVSCSLLGPGTTTT